MQKSARHAAILDLIHNSRIAKQGELAEQLRQAGFRVTQASVSRDLEELGVVKIEGYYGLPARAEKTGIGPVDIRYAGDHLIVVRCTSGYASAAAAKIDSAGIIDIIGTIAGDDTVFIAVNGHAVQKKVAKRVLELF